MKNKQKTKSLLILNVRLISTLLINIIHQNLLRNHGSRYGQDFDLQTQMSVFSLIHHLKKDKGIVRKRKIDNETATRFFILAKY